MRGDAGDELAADLDGASLGLEVGDHLGVVDGSEWGEMDAAGEIAQKIIPLLLPRAEPGGTQRLDEARAVFAGLQQGKAEETNSFVLAGGGEGNIEGAGIDYILPYWMGRYYGVISADPQPPVALSVTSSRAGRRSWIIILSPRLTGGPRGKRSREPSSKSMWEFASKIGRPSRCVVP